MTTVNETKEKELRELVRYVEKNPKAATPIESSVYIKELRFLLSLIDELRALRAPIKRG